MDIDSKDITKQIRAFKSDLRKKTPQEIVTKYLTTGEIYLYDYHTYAQLKTDIADYFSIHPNEVVIVGSAKMGFSLAEKKRTNPKTGKKGKASRYQHFSLEDSDIDVAICNPLLYEKYWKLGHKFENLNGIWNTKKDFLNYLLHGWIRPDFLPNIEERNDWFDYFKSLSSSGKYGNNDIKCGLYKDWGFLEDYQSKAVRDCKNELEIEKLTK